MPENQSIGNEFLQKITEVIGDNISNEQFGVTELAEKIGMSRSNLLRKIKKLTGLSVSQFIRQQRLEYAMELLIGSSLTVSEVSYKVGFGSTSYFIKCFHDQYGYPPGEAVERSKVKDLSEKSGKRKKRQPFVWIFSIVVFVVIAILFTIIKPVSIIQRKHDKSIAVLPFKNESNDSTNVYFINGLMESVLTNLQKIKGLRVISRTSVEKYRNSNNTIPELARELDVTYFVEGSGQKIGNKIQLNIQLIDSHKEKHLWAEQYYRELTDIFSLQNEVAKNIATEIEVYITPEEEKRINKIPTENMQAYDSFLKGLDLINNPANVDPVRAISFFREAIRQDKKFARSFAGIAIAYYLLDTENPVNQYSDSINFYADKAQFYDSELPQSLIAKALYYMNTRQYQQAVGYLKKSLDYNPNYDIALAYMVEIYANYLPDTEEYLKYALKGIQLDIASYDSITRSVIYLHLSNAFIQSGFIDEAKKYIYQSLAYDLSNLYAEYVKAYILYAENQDLQLLNKSLIQTFQKDTTRLDVLQEVAKSYYYLRDYENAYRYYHAFNEARNKYNLDIYRSEDLKIAYTCSLIGKKVEAERYISQFKAYAENDPTIYKEVNLAMYYSAIDEPEKALEHLKLFSEQEHYHYWTLLFVKQDPVMDAIRDYQDFKKIFSEIKSRFEKYHDQIQASLRTEGLM